MNRLQLVAPFIFCGLGACGLAHTVDRDLLRAMTIEQKLLLFDAQNEVAITLDEREELRQDIAELKLDRQKVARAIRDAEEDADRADDKGDVQAEQISNLAAEVFELQSDYLDEALTYARDRLAAHEQMVKVAHAKFELAKARLVKDNNLPGASSIDLEDFEEQVDSAVEDAQEERAELKEQQTEVDNAKKAWLQQREVLNKKSGGALGNPWVDGSETWGDP